MYFHALLSDPELHTEDKAGHLEHLTRELAIVNAVKHNHVRSLLMHKFNNIFNQI